MGNGQRKPSLFPRLAGLRHLGPLGAEHCALRVGDDLLMSGWLLGGDRIARRHAALDVPFGGRRGSLRFSPAVPRAAPRDVQAALQRTIQLNSLSGLCGAGTSVPAPTSSSDIPTPGACIPHRNPISGNFGRTKKRPAGLRPTGQVNFARVANPRTGTERGP